MTNFAMSVHLEELLQEIEEAAWKTKAEGEHPSYHWTLQEAVSPQEDCWRYQLSLQPRTPEAEEALSLLSPPHHYLTTPVPLPWLAEGYKAYFSRLEGWTAEEVAATGVKFAHQPKDLFGLWAGEAGNFTPLECLLLLLEECHLTTRAGKIDTLNPRETRADLLLTRLGWSFTPASSQGPLDPQKFVKLLPEGAFPHPSWEDSLSTFFLAPTGGILSPLPSPTPEEAYLQSLLPIPATTPLLLYLLREEERERLLALATAWREDPPPLSPVEEAKAFASLLAVLPWHGSVLPSGWEAPELLERARRLGLSPLALTQELWQLPKHCKEAEWAPVVDHLLTLAKPALQEAVSPLERAVVEGYLSEEVVQSKEESLSLFATVLLHQTLAFLSPLPLVQEEKHRLFHQLLPSEVLTLAVRGDLKRRLTAPAQDPPEPYRPRPLFREEDLFHLFSRLIEAVGAEELASFFLSLPESTGPLRRTYPFLLEHSELIYLPYSWWEAMVEEEEDAASF